MVPVRKCVGRNSKRRRTTSKKPMEKVSRYLPGNTHKPGVRKRGLLQIRMYLKGQTGSITLKKSTSRLGVRSDLIKFAIKKESFGSNVDN